MLYEPLEHDKDLNARSRTMFELTDQKIEREKPGIVPGFFFVYCNKSAVKM